MWPLWVFDPEKVEKPDESQAEGSRQELLLLITFGKESFFLSRQTGSEVAGQQGSQRPKAAFAA